MLTFELTCRGPDGEVVDPAAVGVGEVVRHIRALPPDRGDGDPEYTVWGPARRTLEAVEELSRHVAALRTACVVAVGEEAPDGLAGDRVLDELECTLLVSRRSAQHTRAVAEAVGGQPEVWAALARGRVDLTRARILADAVLELPRWSEDGTEFAWYAAERGALIAEGLEYAEEHTARRLALFLRRALLRSGVDDRPGRRRRALAERGVWIAHDGEGTADLTARLSSEDAERVYGVLRAVAIADRNGDPANDSDPVVEPLDGWLAAALVDTVLGSLAMARDLSCDADDPDAQPGQRPRRRGVAVSTVVNVTIPVESLAGLRDLPGVINEFGVIPAEDARRLAAGDARWRHVLTCRTSGAVLDVGTLSYRPPPGLARHVRLRDGTCRFPGCAVPAQECDLDHLIPFPDGPTNASNLHALCRRHHGLKHGGGWSVVALSGSRLRWTSPQGAVATSHPDDTIGRVA